MAKGFISGAGSDRLRRPPKEGLTGTGERPVVNYRWIEKAHDSTDGQPLLRAFVSIPHPSVEQYSTATDFLSTGGSLSRHAPLSIYDKFRESHSHT